MSKFGGLRKDQNNPESTEKCQESSRVLQLDVRYTKDELFCLRGREHAPLVSNIKEVGVGFL